MRITELFTAQSIALDEALTDQEQIISRLVELQATHGNITDKDAYKKALYAREAEGSTYVDNGITVPHAKTNVVTRPSLAALRLSSPVQYNAEDDGTTDLLFAIAAPENGSLHVDMLARMMQMLMNEDFVEKLKAAKTPAEFLDCIDAQEEAQFGAESFTQQEIPQSGYRILAVTACVNGIAHTYMAAEALTKAGDKLGLPTKVETNGSDGAKNILTRAEIAACDGIIVAAEKKVDTARFDGKPVRDIELPGICTAAGFDGDDEAAEIYYSVSGYTAPATIYKLDVASGESTLFKAPDVNFDPALFTTEQVFYTSKDGTKVPMFISSVRHACDASVTKRPVSRCAT